MHADLDLTLVMTDLVIARLSLSPFGPTEQKGEDRDNSLITSTTSTNPPPILHILHHPPSLPPLPPTIPPPPSSSPPQLPVQFTTIAHQYHCLEMPPGPDDEPSVDLFPRSSIPPPKPPVPLLPPPYDMPYMP